MNYLEEINYARDSRVRAKDRRLGIRDVDTNRLKAVLVFYDEEGEIETEVNIRFEVCDTCRGKGLHVNPSIDASGLTREDFDEDPSFMEDYLSGLYNVTCYGCDGQRVVPVPAPVTPAEKENVKKWERYVSEEMQYRAQEAVERAMGY